MGIAESVSSVCSEPVSRLGYDLVNVSYEKEFGVWELTLFIKRNNGEPVTHKDCERVSLAVDGLLDELDPSSGEHYNLSVSSVGIE